MAIQVQACCITGSPTLCLSGLPARISAGESSGAACSSCFSVPLSKSGRSFRESRDYALGQARRTRVSKRGAVLVRASGRRQSGT
jgi:hypothetical protein